MLLPSLFSTHADLLPDAIRNNWVTWRSSLIGWRVRLNSCEVGRMRTGISVYRTGISGCTVSAGTSLNATMFDCRRDSARITELEVLLVVLVVLFKP